MPRIGAIFSIGKKRGKVIRQSATPDTGKTEPTQPIEEPLSVSIARKEDTVCCNEHPIYKADPLAFYVFFEKVRHHNKQKRFQGGRRNQYVADDYIKERLGLSQAQIKLAQYRETPAFIYCTAPQDHHLPLGSGNPNPWMQRMRCILLNLINSLGIEGGDVRTWVDNQSRVDFFNQEFFTEDKRTCLNPDKPLDRSNVKETYESWNCISPTRFTSDDAFLRTRKGKGPATGYHQEKDVAFQWRILRFPDHKFRFTTIDGMKYPAPVSLIFDVNSGSNADWEKYMHGMRNYIKGSANNNPVPGVYSTEFTVQSNLQVVLKLFLFYENLNFSSSASQSYGFGYMRRYRIVAALYAGSADGVFSAKKQEELQYPPTMTIETSIPMQQIDMTKRLRYSNHWRPSWLDLMMSLKEATLQWGADGKILDSSTASGRLYQQLDSTDETGIFTVREVANQYPSAVSDHRVPAPRGIFCKHCVTCVLGWKLASRVGSGN